MHVVRTTAVGDTAKVACVGGGAVDNVLVAVTVAEAPTESTIAIGVAVAHIPVDVTVMRPGFTVRTLGYTAKAPG